MTATLLPVRAGDGLWPSPKPPSPPQPSPREAAWAALLAGAFVEPTFGGWRAHLPEQTDQADTADVPVYAKRAEAWRVLTEYGRRIELHGGASVDGSGVAVGAVPGAPGVQGWPGAPTNHGGAR